MKRLKFLGFALFLGVSFLNACPSYCLTLSGIRTLTRTLVNDSGTSRRRFSDSQLNTWINEAQRQVSARTYCIEISTSFELVSGTTYYATRSDFLSVRRLTYKYFELPETTPAALDGRATIWETSKGGPINYFVRFSSRNMIGFVPFPNAVTDTGTIRMDFYAYASDLSAGTDTPFNAINELTVYHESLAFYAAGIAAAIDGRTDIAGLYFQRYETTIKLMEERCRARPNYTPGLTGSR